MYGHDPAQTSRSSVDASKDTNHLAWSFNGSGDTLVGEPVVGGDGTIYVTGIAAFYAVNPTGTQKWSVPLDACASGFGAPAIATDGTIYFGSADNCDAMHPVRGFLYAETDQGQNSVSQKWAFLAGGYVYITTVGSDGTIYFGTEPATATMSRLYAVNPDGSQKWQDASVGNSFLSLQPGPPSISPTNGTIYVAGTSNLNGTSMTDLFGIIGVDPASGAQSLFYAPPMTVSTLGYPSIADDGSLRFTVSDTMKGNQLYAVDSSGGFKWAANVGGTLDHPAIDAGNNAYCGSGDGQIQQVNADGKPGWSFTKGPEGIPAISGDGEVFFGAVPVATEVIYAVHISDGTTIWNNPSFGGKNPAIGADGTIYAISSGGVLHAFGH